MTMRNHQKKHTPGRTLTTVVMLFYFTAFLLLFLKDLQWQGLALAAGVPVMIWLGVNLLPRLFPCDRLLLSVTNFLCALGVLVLYATKPEAAYRQLMYYGVGLLAMVLCIYMLRIIRSWRTPALLLIPASLLALGLPLVFGR